MTPKIDHVRVAECMHHGILRCSADAPLGEVAGVMAKHRVHAVAITDGQGTRPVGVVSDLDVVAVAASGHEPTARQAAATEPLAVSTDESLHRAARMMAEYGVAHLIALDAANVHPSASSPRSTSSRRTRAVTSTEVHSSRLRRIRPTAPAVRC